MNAARKRSLRNAAFAAATLVIVSPLLLVISTNWFETLFGDRTLMRTGEAAAAIAKAIDEGEPLQAIVTEQARARDQFIRVIDPDGSPIASHDAWEGHGLKHALGDLFYGPDRVEVQRAWERDRGVLLNRPEVTAAREEGLRQECWFSTGGNLYVCATAQRVDTPEGQLLVHVQGSSRRALQALYEARRQLVKLLLFSAAMGLVLAWWLTQRIVQPVERLRHEVLRRATEAVPRAGIDIGRRDELGDLAAAFNTVLQALGDRTRNNEAFLADLAHEFKNPVAAIRAAAERLPQTRLEDQERLQRLSDVLLGSSLKLESLLSELLELARAEAGLSNEDRGPVPIGALLRGVAGSVSMDPRYAGVRFEVEVPDADGELTVEGVSHRLEALLRNLIDNAASFAGDGGWVRAKFEEGGVGVRVIVEDSGPGIPPEALPRVFDRFFTHRSGRSGTGLGLAMARAVAEAHGGTLYAESPPGRGARFTLELPLSAQVGREAQRAAIN